MLSYKKGRWYRCKYKLKKELIKTRPPINLKCRHYYILCLVYDGFRLKFVNKSTSKNPESVSSKFMQFIAQRSLFCVFPSRAVKPLRPLLLHRQDAVAVTIACCLKLENNSSVLKMLLNNHWKQKKIDCIKILLVRFKFVSFYCFYSRPRLMLAPLSELHSKLN